MDFLNPWMLAGLGVVAIPILVHLFSRRNFDVVDWGAMQFLDLHPRTRRRLWLEDLLLLLLRMLLLALLACALARPWLGGSWLGTWLSAAPRDLVLVVDGSSSMAWKEENSTVHERALRGARQLVDQLAPGDTLTLIEARDQPRLLGPSATSDTRAPLALLETVPPPLGSCHLLEALSEALHATAGGRHLQRDVVVLTDGQALPWHVDQTARWQRLDQQLAQLAVKPRLFVADLSNGRLRRATNFTLGRLVPSRETTVTAVPVRFKSTLKATTEGEPTLRTVHWEVDGQRLPAQARQIRLVPGVEVPIELEYTFEREGSHVVAMVLDDDELVSDNRAEAVVIVSQALRVLLIDGAPQADAVKSETFFARHALAAGKGKSAWVAPTVVPLASLQVDDLLDAEVIIAANVPRFDDPLAQSLVAATSQGRGLIIALGDQTVRDWWNGWSYQPASEAPDTSDADSVLVTPAQAPNDVQAPDAPAQDAVPARAPAPKPSVPVLPGRLEAIASASEGTATRVTIDDGSLRLPWLQPFRLERGATLAEATFDRWWKLTLGAPPEGDGSAGTAAETLVLARLTRGDPWLTLRPLERGLVCVMTSSLDADWNTLPARVDYVPLLHELIFAVSQRTSGRNVLAGQPLVEVLRLGEPIQRAQFVRPDGTIARAELKLDSGEARVSLPEAALPGIYRLNVDAAGGPLLTGEPFAVDFDRTESDLAPLSDPQKNTIRGEERLKWLDDIKLLQRDLLVPTGQIELWSLLLYGLIGLLLAEVWLTRRMSRSRTPEDE